MLDQGRALQHYFSHLQTSSVDRGQKVSRNVGSRRTIFVPLLLFVFVVSCGPAPPSWKSGLKKIPVPQDVAKLEKEMFKRVNRDRSDEGLSHFKWDARLAEIARSHSADMKTSGFFGHVSPNTGHLDDRMVRAGYLNSVCRENVAIAPDVQRAEDGFLKSPGHYANLMSKDVSHIGIGIVRGDSMGNADSLTITQVFATPVNAESPKEAEKILARRIADERRKRGLKAHIKDGKLTRLAQDNIRHLDDNLAKRSLQKINDIIAAELAGQKNRGSSSIASSAHLILSAQTCDLPEEALNKDTIRFGIAAAGAKTDNSAPRIKLLLLLERR